MEFKEKRAFDTYCGADLGLSTEAQAQIAEICDKIIGILKEKELSYKQAVQVLECTKARLADIKI